MSGDEIKVKILPSALLIGVMGAILLSYAVLGATCARQQRDKNDINAQILQLRPALLQTTGRAESRPRPDLAELEQRLALAQARLAAEQASFPAELSSTELSDWVLQLAQETRLKALTLRAKPISTEKIKGHTYKILRLEVDARGSFSELTDFIQRLEEGKFTTLVLAKVSMTVTPGDLGARLSLALYAQLPPQATGTPGSK